MGVVTGGSETISFTEGFEMTESIILEVFGKPKSHCYKEDAKRVLQPLHGCQRVLLLM